MEEGRFRDNVAALVRRTGDGTFLMCARINPPGAWQLVQGGLEPGESVEDACLRELREELGVSTLEPFTIVAKAPPRVYRFPPGVEWTIAKNYDGQSQTVCLVEFSGDDTMFDLTIDEPPEFQDFGWFAQAELAAMCWELKRPIVEAALLYFETERFL